MVFFRIRWYVVICGCCGGGFGFMFEFFKGFFCGGRLIMMFLGLGRDTFFMVLLVFGCL